MAAPTMVVHAVPVRQPGEPRARTTRHGSEICRDLPEVTHFVAGLGTGGTSTGRRPVAARSTTPTCRSGGRAAAGRDGRRAAGARRGLRPGGHRRRLSLLDRKMLVPRPTRCWGDRKLDQRRACSPASRLAPSCQAAVPHRRAEIDEGRDRRPRRRRRAGSTCPPGRGRTTWRPPRSRSRTSCGSDRRSRRGAAGGWPADGRPPASACSTAARWADGRPAHLSTSSRARPRVPRRHTGATPTAPGRSTRSAVRAGRSPPPWSRRGVKMVVVRVQHGVGRRPRRDCRTSARSPSIGVIEPGGPRRHRATRNGRVGVIGTVGTIASGAYDRAVTGLGPAPRHSAAPGLSRVRGVRRAGRDRQRPGARRWPAVARPGAPVRRRHADAGLHALPVAAPAPSAT